MRLAPLMLSEGAGGSSFHAGTLRSAEEEAPCSAELLGS